MSDTATDTSFPSGLLVGWETAPKGRSAGFRSEEIEAGTGDPVIYDGEGHLMTIAPTGAGKGVGCVVPAILRHEGAVLVMDLKAENYAMTRRHRRAMGSDVACIDPFGIAQRIVEGAPDASADEIKGFNPLDLLPYLSDDRATACRALADMLISKDGHSVDPFWRDAAVGVIAALVAHYDRLPGHMRSISAIVNDLSMEVPGARYPGHIPLEDNARSRIEADPDLLDEMTQIGLDVETVMIAYRGMNQARAEGPSPIELREMILSAFESGVTAGRTDPKGDSVDGESILQEFFGLKARRSEFLENILVWKQEIEVPEDMVEKLWGVMVGADRDSRKRAPQGALASMVSRRDPPPENYPLALHRLARSADQMSRSAASQPMTADKTWGSIICTVRAELAQFSGRSIARTLGAKSSLDLEALRQGEDLSVFLAFPPSRIRSHANLFRVMVEGVLAVITSRTERPPRRTLLLLDEVAQLGRIDLLVTAKTLLRGYGVQVWSFWQDISQLRTLYPRDWQTVLNNCRVIQVFGRGTGVMVNELSQALDVSPDRIADLAPEDLLAWVDLGVPRVLRRPVCYEDLALRNLCDDGPFAYPAPDAGMSRIGEQSRSKSNEPSSDEDMLDEEGALDMLDGIFPNPEDENPREMDLGDIF